VVEVFFGKFTPFYFLVQDFSTTFTVFTKERKRSKKKEKAAVILSKLPY